MTNAAHKVLLNVADPNGIGFHRAGKVRSNVADKLRTLQRGRGVACVAAELVTSFRSVVACLQRCVVEDI